MLKPPSDRAASGRPASQPSSAPAARLHGAVRRAGRFGATLLLALGLAFALSATTGCMVMDELDTAAAKMPTTNKKDAKPAASAKTMTPAERLAAAKSAVNERSKQWWKEAKTMTPGEKPAGIVNCRLSDGVRFMSKDDCIVQGGRPADGSS
ncbi:MAG: hypothetical protein IPK00_13285 [Deltaproteobacteria bacterium]|nr:hypothetical protein [Deltaproteobacteria bacterium]